MTSDGDTPSGVAQKILPEWLTKPTSHSIKPWMKISAGIIVVFAIVFIAMYCRTMGDTDASLYGFWEVDGDFAEKAHLDAMYLYIGAPDNDARSSLGPLGRDLPIYVFLKADCTVRFNEVVKSHMSRRSLRTDTIQKYSIDFPHQVSIIPKNVSAEYDPVTQMLVLRDSKRVYARMFKKPEISFYCTAESMTPSKSKKTSKSSTRTPDVDDDIGDHDNDAPDDSNAADTTDTGAEENDE